MEVDLADTSSVIPVYRVVQLSNDSMDAIVVVNLDGTILEANPAATQLLAPHLTTLVGQPFGIPVSVGAKVEIEISRSERIHHAEMFVGETVVDGSPAYLIRIVDVTETRDSLAALKYNAEHDALTSLSNRAKLNEELAAACDKRDEAFAIIYIDIDHFKTLNDTLGHTGGDTVLQTIARRLSGIVRGGDVAARFGGDEFLLLCRGVDSQRKAEALLARVNRCFDRPLVYQGKRIPISGSLGVALFPTDGTTPDALIEIADASMYRAKLTSREPVSPRFIFSRDEVQSAVESQEIAVYYQPQIDLKTDKRIAAEALCCWNHPQLGFLRASEFIEAAEEFCLVTSIDQAVLETVCNQVVNWELEKVPVSHVAVNLSPASIADSKTTEWISEIVTRTGARPEMIEVEISERAELTSEREATLRALKSLGLRLAIDDFGAGATSLRWLDRLPIDTLKLDGSLIDGCDSNPRKQAIIESVVLLCKRLRINLVAEGVESIRQLQQLQALGCPMVQGFAISNALDAQQLLFFTKSDQLLAHRPIRLPRPGKAVTNLA